MKHLTVEQRYNIFAYQQAGMPQNKIAHLIGVHPSTVCREIKRNADKRNGVYKPELAQRKYADRLKSRKHYLKLKGDVQDDVVSYLLRDLSPEQITGRLRSEGKESVSHETIYLYVWRDKKYGSKGLYTHLRRKGRRHKKRGALTNGRGFIKNRVDIEMRPKIVDEKSRFGDLEIDTVIGRNHKGALLTINDRVTGMVWIRLLAGKEAEPLTQATIEALGPFKGQIHTITADNGKEFSKHETIAGELDIQVYFAKPYHSWERGANENTNGLIRQYFPKGTDFRNVTNEQVMKVQDILNNRPRKRLGYLTPLEMYNTIMNRERNPIAFSI